MNVVVERNAECVEWSLPCMEIIYKPKRPKREKEN